VNFSHVFISRPRQEAEELARMLEPLGLEVVVQPAFSTWRWTRANDPAGYARLEAAAPGDLVVFTSPQAVEHGLRQIPAHSCGGCRWRRSPGQRRGSDGGRHSVAVAAGAGYTSEALLAALAGNRPARPSSSPRPAAADALPDGLSAAGWRVGMLMVYRAEPARARRGGARRTRRPPPACCRSGPAAMRAGLSQRLPPAVWFKLCEGEWVVISERLRRLARAYGPGRIHLARGPGNGALLAAIRGLL
jgi:hypothetical protein